MGAFEKLAGMLGPRREPGETVAREILGNASAEIAYRIRAELVCCDVYERVVDRHELTLRDAMANPDWHDLCYWGEAAARLAEGRCPGYDTRPSICRCACDGCVGEGCGAHVGEPGVPLGLPAQTARAERQRLQLARMVGADEGTTWLTLLSTVAKLRQVAKRTESDEDARD